MSHWPIFPAFGKRKNVASPMRSVPTDKVCRGYLEQGRRYQIWFLIVLAIPFLGGLFESIIPTLHPETGSGEWNAVIALSMQLLVYRSTQILLYAVLTVYILYLTASLFAGWRVRRSSVPFIAAHLFLVAGNIHFAHKWAVSSYQLLGSELTALNAKIDQNDHPQPGPCPIGHSSR